MPPRAVEPSKQPHLGIEGLDHLSNPGERGCQLLAPAPLLEGGRIDVDREPIHSESGIEPPAAAFMEVYVSNGCSRVPNDYIVPILIEKPDKAVETLVLPSKLRGLGEAKSPRERLGKAFVDTADHRGQPIKPLRGCSVSPEP